MNFDAVFQEHQRVVAQSAEVLPAVLIKLTELLSTAIRNGSKILICGNGGSAADAQHFAAELVGRFEAERRALPALALTTDTSAITAIANDHGFDTIFSRQVEAFARPGDVLIAVSTSGNSPNILRAAIAARELDCKVVGLTGQTGGQLSDLSDLLLQVPSQNVARIQEVHVLCLHAVAGAVESAIVAAESQ